MFDDPFETNIFEMSSKFLLMLCRAEDAVELQGRGDIRRVGPVDEAV